MENNLAGAKTAMSDEHHKALRELGGLQETVDGQWLKGYLPDEHGELGKTYLSRQDAVRYGQAFLAWAAT